MSRMRVSPCAVSAAAPAATVWARAPVPVRSHSTGDDRDDDPWGLVALLTPPPRVATAEEKASLTAIDATFARLATRVGRANATETVAVLDSGAALSHPFLRARAWTNTKEIAGNGIDDDGNGKVDDVHGWDFVNDRADLTDDNGHGTHVAGIAAHGTERIRVMPLRVSNPLTAAAVSAAIDYAAAEGVRVVNLSQAAAGREVVAGIKAAMAAHPEMLFVKSAGNSNMKLGGFWCSVNGDNYLSANALPNMLVVANADRNGKRFSDSNYGEQFVDLAAPGVSVPSCDTHGGVAIKSGTSMSAPLVASIAAKCLVLNPGLTVADLRHILTSTCQTSRAWEHKVRSGGVLNPERAMSVAALSALIDAGELPESAADRLELTGGERAFALRLALRMGAKSTNPA